MVQQLLLCWNILMQAQAGTEKESTCRKKEKKMVIRVKVYSAAKCSVALLYISITKFLSGGLSSRCASFLPQHRVTYSFLLLLPMYMLEQNVEIKREWCILLLLSLSKRANLWTVGCLYQRPCPFLFQSCISKEFLSDLGQNKAILGFVEQEKTR